MIRIPWSFLCLRSSSSTRAPTRPTELSEVTRPMSFLHKTGHGRPRAENECLTQTLTLNDHQNREPSCIKILKSIIFPRTRPKSKRDARLRREQPTGFTRVQSLSQLAIRRSFCLVRVAPEHDGGGAAHKMKGELNFRTCASFPSGAGTSYASPSVSCTCVPSVSFHKNGTIWHSVALILKTRRLAPIEFSPTRPRWPADP